MSRLLVTCRVCEEQLDSPVEQQLPFPSLFMPADSLAEHTGPRLGSVSVALGNEKTKSNIICVSDCVQQ